MTRKALKKALSLLLVFALVWGSISWVQVPVYADGSSEFEGSGDSSEDPYLINTAADLAKLAELVNSDDAAVRDAYKSKYYKLMSSIALSDYQADQGWTPIGTAEKPFMGTFDGNGNEVTGLKINSSASYQGLFGNISGGTVRNLGVTNIDIQGGNYVGWLFRC